MTTSQQLGYSSWGSGGHGSSFCLHTARHLYRTALRLDGLAALGQELADGLEVFLQSLLEVAALERAPGEHQLAEVTAGAMRRDQRVETAVVDAALGQRGVVRTPADLQVGNQLVDDLRLLG